MAGLLFFWENYLLFFFEKICGAREEEENNGFVRQSSVSERYTCSDLPRYICYSGFFLSEEEEKKQKKCC